MAEILMTTLNAKYPHAAFGLRYLHANLGALRHRARILEFPVSQRPVDVAEALLQHDPTIIGVGIYIWNVTPATELLATLRSLKPGIVLVLGGPEVSYEFESQPIVKLADYVIAGEADLEFPALCEAILAGSPPPTRVIQADPPDLSKLALPYDLYGPEDIAHRILYVEASRGCPFGCEFCLSSLDIPVRQANLPEFLAGLDRLLQRGARQLKFVDRTFNLNVHTCRAILQFLLDRYQPHNFFHFEMVPDRLPPELREIIARFPPGALQFEVGIQTFNEKSAALIHRRQNYARLEDNFRFLRNSTGVHLHADLIAGLPGEDFDSLASSFDRLIALQPHEIQLGILKRLRGTPIGRHDADWGMVYSPHPPYEILQNKLLDFPTMQQIRRFARYWDLVGNSGHFVETVRLIWEAPGRPDPSPFREFLAWANWLYQHTGRTDGIALLRLMELLFRYLVDELKLDRPATARTLWRDYQRSGHRDPPPFLKPFLTGAKTEPSTFPRSPHLPKRQARHLAVNNPPQAPPFPAS